MVHIKFVARPKIPMFSSDFESIALDEAPKVSAQHKEVLTEQPEVSWKASKGGPRWRLLRHLVRNSITRANPVILRIVKLPPTILGT
jgi:hypothetical protein